MTDKTLKELLTEGVERFNNSDKPALIIDNAIEKLFYDVIDREFCFYSDFSEAVKDAIKKALPVNIQDIISLPKYNKLIVDSLQQQWLTSGVEQDFINKATKLLNEIIDEHPLPKYIYLSDLLESFVEHYKEEAMDEEWEHPDIRIEESGNFANFVHIYFDKQPKNTAGFSYSNHTEKSKYLLDNNLACHALNEKVKSKYDDDREYDVYEVYSVKFCGQCMGKLLQTNCNKFETLMMALYCGSSNLVIDCNEDDITYPNYCD